MHIRTVAGAPLLLLPLLTLALSACVGGEITNGCSVSDVTVTTSAASVAVGQTVQANAEYSAINCAFPPAATWSSSNSAIASVDENGTVRGVSVGGPVQIRATVLTRTNTTAVTVVAPAIVTAMP